MLLAYLVPERGMIAQLTTTPPSRLPHASGPDTLPTDILSGDGLLRAEVYSSERLERHAIDLANWHRVEGGRGGSSLLARLTENAHVLQQTFAQLRDAAAAGRPAVPAGEWLLDNHHQVREQIALVRRHLPRRYSRQLPQLAVGNPVGLPRVYALALELIAHADGRVEDDILSRFIATYQMHAPLALGELWAVPIMLRLALIENLRRVAVRVERTQRERAAAEEWALRITRVADENPSSLVIELADLARADAEADQLTASFVAELHRRLQGHQAGIALVLQWLDQRLGERHTTVAELIRADQQQLAGDQIAVENAFSSLSRVGSNDWRAFVEYLSPLESALGRDPANIYSHMDVATRDRYRQEIEGLARRCPGPAAGNELAVVATVLALAQDADLARSAGGSALPGSTSKEPALTKATPPPSHHVGWWLIDGGRAELELRLARELHLKRPRVRAGAPLRFLFYAGPLMVLTFILCLAMTSAVDAFSNGWMVALALLLAAWLPASQTALHVVNWFSSRQTTPRALPRLDLSGGVPAQLRTAVVVPTMLRKSADLEPLLEGLLVRALANPDDELVYALLTDGGDATTLSLEGEDQLLERARQAIVDLNAAHPTAAGGGRFLLLHRHRVWDAAEKMWMGRERKRGKLEDFNRLLLHGDTTPWRLIAGERQWLSGVQFVITLDTDTRLPRDAARSLIAAMAHPLVAPRVAADGKTVVGGHALLQPRAVIDLSSAQRSWYAMWWSGDPGLDPYTRTVSDVYQDLFDAGSYIGKGIYALAAFDAALDGQLPDDAILSHDLIEGSFVRAGLATDVLVVEDHPTRYLADASRRKRWIRGDWQLLPWLFPTVPTAHGQALNPLSALARWKLADNLRRSFLAPAIVVFLFLAWTLLPATGAMTASLLVVAMAVVPVLLGTLGGIIKPTDLPLSEHVSRLGNGLVRGLITTVSELSFLPFEALLTLDAIVRTWWRLLISRRHLLEWQTSSDAERLSGAGLLAVMRTMWMNPLLAALALVMAWQSPLAAPAMLPLSALWFCGPFIAWWLSRERRIDAVALSEDEQLSLSRSARLTWHYFEDQIGPHTGWLPCDNVQDEPVAAVAMRTSPTNIGIALLSELAAHDFGWQTTAGLLQRLTASIEAMEKLERYRGHLLNWYDLHNASPLAPRYVSMVDSGNLAGHLLVLAAGLRERRLHQPRVATRLRGCAITMQLAIDALPGGDQLRPLLTAVTMRMRHAARGVVSTEAESRVFSEVLDACVPLQANFTAAFTASGESLRWFKQAVSELTAHQEELRQWAANSEQHIASAERLAQRAHAFALGMEWGFLFDVRAKLFTIGYHVDEARLDRSYYDLLASEARLGSYVAIATGQVPQEHWFRLGRPGVRTAVGTCLVSWSGTLFEYLMPSLVMPEPHGTLLSTANHVAVDEQIRYARTQSIPWGISESAYLITDAQLNWQYRAFGVPGLGLKRGLGDDLVVAPYATALALLTHPQAALANLRRLAGLGAIGRYGYCEALDFTRARLPSGKDHALIRSWMVHHQGMALLAYVHVLEGAPMHRRFLADPMLQAHRLLLQERPAPAAAKTEDAGPETQERLLSEPMLRIVTDPLSPLPEVHLLSNGRYHVLVSAAGGGLSRWQDLALTRWREDATRDNWGQFCYLRDERSGVVWSAAHQPIGRPADAYEAIFTQAKAEFRRSDEGITTHTEIIVSPEDDMELRRLTLTNRSDVERTIEVTTYAEPVLAPMAADLAHPAFSNLFIETSMLGEALLASRRPRSTGEPRRWLVHLLVARGTVQSTSSLSCESERINFIGRGRSVRNPIALSGTAGPLSGSLGAVLDPVLSLRRSVILAPGERAVFDIVYAVADSQAGAAVLAERYRDDHLADRARSLAVTHGQVVLAQLGVSEAEVQAYARIAGSLVFASAHRRPNSATILRNRRTRSGLWSNSISGDLPICLLRINDGNRLDLVREVVRAHGWWRSHGLAVDLVILIEDPSVYRQEVSERVIGLVAASTQVQLLDSPAGIFIRRLDQVPEEDRHLLLAFARVVITDAGGTLTQYADRRLRTPAQAPRLETQLIRYESAALTEAPVNDLLFDNGTGGFTRDGKEYIITLTPQTSTPSPWCNVLANPGFGTVISESGSAYTWAENCHEFRLTPWRCDAVVDPTGEALYIRDEETGVAWSPTIGPRRGQGTYVVRHGFGYTACSSDEEGIAAELHQWVDATEPVKHFSLRLVNRSRRPRRLSTWLYLEWTLGELRERTAMHLATSHEDGVLLATNPLHDEFSQRCVFACASRKLASWTCDRGEFLGRAGSPTNPAALQAKMLLGRAGAGFDPCAAMQVMVELEPGQEQRVVFTMGAGTSRDHARGLARAHASATAAQTSLSIVYEYWKRLLSTVQVHTSDPAFDLLANGWLPYQVIAARLFARSGFSQSGGAFGFRDQLQDTMALVHHAPQLLREQLLRAASRQFAEGDVQHWWHPPLGRGVRTRISDDYLWLPYALARYVMATGDRGVLDVRVPFLHGQQVPMGQDSLYDLPQISDEQGTLYEHAVRAVLRGMNYGEHGLPLMGTGDWNDGMDRVGAHGKGESVWLGFFLGEVLQRFTAVARLAGDAVLAERLALEAVALGKRLDVHAWDGDWYLRAWFDDGTPLGSSAGRECRIDALPQAWAALTAITDPQRTRQALAAVDRELVREQDQLIQLFDPPFGGKGENDDAAGGLQPGYIKGYVPGVRENGGQYTHAAVWTAMAHAALGDGQRALDLMRMINPINHARDAAGCARWRGEPYVMAADVYRSPGHVGQAGWTWYTGSAGWMWRLMVESLLGLDLRDGAQLHFKPTTPASFGDFSLTYRCGEAVYHITVTGAGQVRQVTLDGVMQANQVLPLLRSAGEHTVVVERGT